MNNPLQQRIIEVIKNSLRHKFAHYRPETNEMPFHYRLLGRDRMALFSFIHSLNTTFGTSIFEPVAIAISELRFKKVVGQFVLGNTISETAQTVISNIINDLTSGTIAPNKAEELLRIREPSISGQPHIVRVVQADLFIQDNEGQVYLFDIKTAKPNVSNFVDFKRTLLEWASMYYRQDHSAKVHTLLAIPYNPYEPEPYRRWTMRGMLDLGHEILVADEFWDFLGGKGTYEMILDCFEKAGLEMRDEIDNYFLRFR